MSNEFGNAVKTNYELTFDEEKHKYYVNGRSVPGISEILKAIGLTRNYEKVDPFYRERGTFAHKAIELDLEGDLDFDGLDLALKPFVSAWRAFVQKHGYKKILCEEKLWSSEENYACRIDHYGEVDGRRTVFDVKCTKSHDPAADWQVCGQAFALADNYAEPEQQGILELHDDGTFEWFPSDVNLEIMPALMKLFHRKQSRKK